MALALGEDVIPQGNVVRMEKYVPDKSGLDSFRDN